QRPEDNITRAPASMQNDALQGVRAGITGIIHRRNLAEWIPRSCGKTHVQRRLYPSYELWQRVSWIHTLSASKETDNHGQRVLPGYCLKIVDNQGKHTNNKTQEQAQRRQRAQVTPEKQQQQQAGHQEHW